MRSVFLLLLAALLIGGCESPLSGAVGSRVLVTLKPEHGAIGGDVQGKLLAARNGWLEIEESNGPGELSSVRFVKEELVTSLKTYPDEQGQGQ